jgi:hypothetical protein
VRNKVTICTGLAAVVLAIGGPPFVALSVRPYEPPLRTGMSPEEIHGVLGKPWIQHGYFIGTPRCFECFDNEPDWLGGHKEVTVSYDSDKAIGFQSKPLPRVRPPLLDTALRAAGW